MVCWPRKRLRQGNRFLGHAQSEQTAHEYGQGQKMARMMDDPAGKELTMALVDQAFRSHRSARIADQLRHLLKRYGTPQYMDWWERAALSLGGVLAHYWPTLVVPPMVARLRQETSNVILPGEEGDLGRYLQTRRQRGVRLNLNQLGEAILGEEEAARRLDAYLELLAREDVEYISVKISSVFSQINLVAFDHTVEEIKARLRTLYRRALTYRYQPPDGAAQPKFINLDMEEYRDLHLTVQAFCEVLNEPEFLRLRAGIVLQAYLPDAFPVQQYLTEWSSARVARGGAPIKIRVVKGVNLAMEKVEAALHGWQQAPYHDKCDVDANFKRMISYGCQPKHAAVAHIGVASHNLFDIAYALLLRQRLGVHEQVEFEMLEGMANHQARAVQTQAGGLLLYAPVVKAADFHSAIAYLVRRLDENTAEDNFLHDLFGLEPGSEAWEKQRSLFLQAVDRQDQVSTTPNRTQDRRRERLLAAPTRPFDNVPDTDFSLSANQQWIKEIVNRWSTTQPQPIPLQIGGDWIHAEMQGEGIDPSRPGEPAYAYSLAGQTLVNRALEVATQAQPGWGHRTVPERRAILLDISTELAKRRGNFIGSMMLDAGKTVSEADPEVSEAIDFARYYARALDAETLGAEVWDCRMTPLGVVVVTPPWNFPLAIPAGGVLASLMAGNAVIFKPAPEAVLVGWHLAQAFWAAGVPQEVLQFVPVPDNEIGQALVTDPRVDAVILTGSLQTARRFQTWNPEIRLFAETSGKNSLIITSMADQDQAIKDLVRSAFGHNGQKCSAASLAILEAEVYDSETFRRQLCDAVASLAVGPAWDVVNVVTPRTQLPSPELERGLTTLEPGESWLLKPRMLDGNARLWSPGIKLGVQPGSFLHQTECFGPLLGLMRAKSLAEAVEMANAVDFGLTSGLHTLDDREVAFWKDRIAAGNLYINRHITGAIVRRQPFGGWKASVVGPGAKAGGPNYVLQFVDWHQVSLPRQVSELSPAVSRLLGRGLAALASAVPQDEARLRASAGSYAWAWQSHFSLEHDPSQIRGEVNVFRYRPCQSLMLRIADNAEPVAVMQALLAVRTTGQPLRISLGPAQNRTWRWLDSEADMQVVVEDEEGLVEHLEASGAHGRLRIIGTFSEALRRAANRVGVAIIDPLPLVNGRLELRYYLREQAVSQTVHRYGNLMQNS
ncbi:proline dehydrogenase family protein [Candidatus Entotheonella palauensis]|uniref:proline dehydrogenase family protein n=1 Tax=Candidatus Entotheonella palauensis TaxID=93172 RepID=UPI000B7FF471